MVQESLIEGIFRSLKKNAGWATLIIGLSVASAVLINKYFPTVYETSALLRVMTTESSHNTSLAASMNGILSQKSIIKEALTECGLESDYKKENLYNLEDKGNGLVKLSLRHENPNALKDLGNSVIKILSNQFLGYSSEERDFELKALNKKVSHLENQISITRMELAKASANSTTQIDDATLELENTLHQLEEKIEIGQKRLQTIPEVTFYSVWETNANHRSVSRQLTEAQNKLAELFKTYMDKHPKVIAAKTRIARLEKKLKASKTRKRKKKSNKKYIALKSEIISDKEKLELLKTEIDKRKKVANLKISESEQSVRNLSLRVSTLEELHRNTLLKLEETKISQTTTLGKIKVLKKDRRLPQAVGFSPAQRDCIALLSGVLVAIFLLYTPTPVKAELIGVSGEMLAGANFVPPPPMLTAEPIETILQVPSLTPDRLALPAPDSSAENCHYDERLIALNEPNSKKLAPYRTLLSNLQISISESQTRIVLVGSSRAGTGRTTLLANTAVLLAQAGYSVLMVDANFRNPILHRVFDLENIKGLSDALKGENPQYLIQETSISRLSLLSAGAIPANPTELLGSHEIIELLASLKRKVEVILIDTPAILDYPDTGVLAGHTGGMVFLHNENEPEKDIRASKKLLKKIGAKILGYVKV